METYNSIKKKSFIIDFVESSISDRGIQYCCPDYTEFTRKLGFKMSTTQKYDPYENAVAERIKGILKYEMRSIHEFH
ncbi:MAG: transposase family protein [Chryseobacterium sp.]|nr:transposase family protein [Chryseobacterium sp.]